MRQHTPHGRKKENTILSAENYYAQDESGYLGFVEPEKIIDDETGQYSYKCKDDRFLCGDER